MTRRSTVGLLACLLAAGLALAACSEKQEASSLPSKSAAPTEDALPPLGPEDFPVPAEAREKTPAGALAFAKYYMALGTEIGLSDIPAQSLLDLSTPDCRLCRQVAETFSADQAAGYRRQGSTSTFKDYGAPLLSGDTADIGFAFSQSADRVVDRQGNDVASRAGQASGVLQSGMQLTWRDDLKCWLVNSLTIG
jgi:hypothetical protein